VIILPRQTTPYTCGPACLATVTRLVTDRTVYEAELAQELGALPGIGVDHDDLANWAQKNDLPVTSEGEGTYDGGVAIANIKNPTSHIGHFVIMLGRRGDIYRYYCPLFGEVFEKHRDQILWENMNGELKNWSVSFACDKDYYDSHIEAEQHVFILGDELESLQPEFDTSLLLQDAYKKRGQSVSWSTPDEVYTRARLLHLSGVPVLKNDIVWMRCDPVNTVHYYELLRRISHMDAKILNNPKAILTFHDKLSRLYVDDSNCCTVSTKSDVKKALRHLIVLGFERYIVKKPSNFGGVGVHLVNNEDEAYDAFHELAEDSGYVIIQGYIETGDRQVDTRVMVTQDAILGSLDRVAKEGDFLCNLHAGATAQLTGDLSQKRVEQVKKIQNLMKDNDIFMAGIDFLGDILIEINVTCPSSIRQLNQVTGKIVEEEIIDLAWDYTGTKSFATKLLKYA